MVALRQLRLDHFLLAQELEHGSPDPNLGAEACLYFLEALSLNEGADGRALSAQYHVVTFAHRHQVLARHRFIGHHQIAGGRAAEESRFLAQVDRLAAIRTLDDEKRAP